MAISYIWTFNPFTVIGDEKTVTAIPWVLTASDGKYQAAHSNTTSLGPPPAKAIPFDEITEKNAIDWVSASIDVPALQATLAAALAQMSTAKKAEELPPLLKKDGLELDAAAPAVEDVKAGP